MELTGKDAAIVLNSADIDKAAAAISWGALLNAGQSCSSIERIYVQENVLDNFIDKLTQRVNRLRLNYPNIQEWHPDCKILLHKFCHPQQLLHFLQQLSF